MDNYRRVIIDELVPWFRNDQRYMLLVGDMGFGAIDKLREEFPQRIINCGIMEQTMVGVAAGMNMSGMKPIIYSMVNFLAYRALEQVRNDIVLQGLDVKLIGTGADNYFTMLGDSHCCGRDDVTVMEMINMKVYDPVNDDREFSQLLNDWMNDECAGYIRV